MACQGPEIFVWPLSFNGWNSSFCSGQAPGPAHTLLPRLCHVLLSDTRHRENARLSPSTCLVWASHSMARLSPPTPRTDSTWPSISKSLGEPQIWREVFTNLWTGIIVPLSTSKFSLRTEIHFVLIHDTCPESQCTYSNKQYCWRLSLHRLNHGKPPLPKQLAHTKCKSDYANITNKIAKLPITDFGQSSRETTRVGVWTKKTWLQCPRCLLSFPQSFVC